MVEELIRKYMEAGGKAPIAVVAAADVPLGEIGPNVFCVHIPALDPGTIGVIPLQCALDLVLAAVWMLGDEEEADGE